MSEIKKLNFPKYSTIPFEVLSNENLSPNAKLHYGLIAGLAHNEGYCFAMDEQFADLYNKDIKTIKNWNKELEDSGFIERQCYIYRYRKGNLALIKKKRRIFLLNNPSITPKETSKKDCKGKINSKTRTRLYGEKKFPYNSEGKKEYKGNNVSSCGNVDNFHKEDHCSYFREIKERVPEADDGAIGFWLKEWGNERVIEAVEMMEASKKVGKRPAYVRSILNSGRKSDSESNIENKRLAEEYSKMNKSIKVNKLYVSLGNGRDLYYCISPSEFSKAMSNWFDVKEFRTVEDMISEEMMSFLDNE